ncbi:ATP-binding cassette domain-containing protein [Sphingobacterium psychroaquaticum]|nr:ATP-binding cassette domain-containing protein [Sphingobacterium psychroaquaticum]
MLTVKNIVKQYSNHRALDDVSLTIPKGSIFGLLGPNGAGKTSLIRIINQITAPDQGEVYFDGELLQPKHIARIGYLPEERGLYKKMKIGEQLLYLSQLKGLRKQEAIQKINYWFERLNMGDWWDKKVEDLSKGMQQKVQFVATVVHDPELIILDEPFSGFDPVNAQIIQDEILELNKKGATIIYSTHRMESVEELCDNIALINKSKKILDGSVKDIKRSYRNQTYIVTYQYLDVVDTLTLPPAFEIVENKAALDDYELTVHVDNEQSLNDLLLALIPQVNIKQVSEVIPSMHDIFIKQVTSAAIL